MNFLFYQHFTHILDAKLVNCDSLRIFLPAKTELNHLVAWHKRPNSAAGFEWARNLHNFPSRTHPRAFCLSERSKITAIENNQNSNNESRTISGTSFVHSCWAFFSSNKTKAESRSDRNVVQCFRPFHIAAMLHWGAFVLLYDFKKFISVLRHASRHLPCANLLVLRNLWRSRPTFCDFFLGRMVRLSAWIPRWCEAFRLFKVVEGTPNRVSGDSAFAFGNCFWNWYKMVF